jgi:ketosteroid isomerase-like protein
VNREKVQAWLDRYIAAWRANDPALIGELFSDEATYRYQPYAPDDEVLRGREAIVAGWLENPDDPGSWEAHYEPYAVDGDRAVAIGTSRYGAQGDQPARTYWNCYLLRFDADGRCSEFTEHYMLEPSR